VTLVETQTDLAVMGVDEAREITNDIKRTGNVMWSQITKAFQGRAWAALGYESWDEYCDAEFDGARLKLPREERTMVVASLADAGMSTRAIAAATGVSRPTIISDLQVVNSLPADPDDEIVDAEVIDDPTPEPRKVTGTDGKSYTLKPKPVVDRRPPLTDAANRIGLDLRKRVESLESLMEDDRFAAHRDALTPMLRSHLTYAIQACEHMLAHINDQGVNQ
jgi:hypothetical protein